MIFNLGGHIGSSVSALVDGQLTAEDEERVWDHVLGCPGCRRLVEREGWVKSRLAGLSAPGAGHEPPRHVVGALYAVGAWGDVDRLEGRSRGRRRAGLAIVGAGSVGAAVFGIASLGGAPLGIGGGDGPAPARISGPTSPPVSPVPVLNPARRGR